MLPITAPRKLLSQLGKFNRRTTIEKLSALLTFPELHANTLRLELLLHLASLHCRGSKVPSRHQLKHWLNEELGDSEVARAEDPAEDVFVHNVMWETGNFRIFEGVWEGNGDYLQEILDAILLGNRPPGSEELRNAVFGLLTISEALASTSEIPRWTMGTGQPHVTIKLPDEEAIEARAGKVTFSVDRLTDLGINPKILDPFILSDRLNAELATQDVGHSNLERYPLIRHDEYITLALPTAVSVAIRRYALEWLHIRGMLRALESRLRMKQSQLVFEELQRHAGVVSMAHVFPSRPNGLLNFDEMLGRFDEDKLCHVLVVPDSLEKILEVGLTKERKIHEMADLISAYLRDVITDLRSRYIGTNGFTLIVIGGLGRGFTFGLHEIPEGWRTSIFSLESFIHYLRTFEASLLRLWKLKREEESIESGGVMLFHPWGDLNLYAYWKSQGYALLGKDIAYPGQSNVAVMQNFVASLREEIKKDYDFHSVNYRTSIYTRVCRMNPHAFFAESRRLPIYADLLGIRGGILRGVVETVRGPWWLTMVANPESTSMNGRRLCFGFWDAIVSWLGKLAPLLDRYCASLREPLNIVVTLEEIDRWSDLVGMEEERLPSPPLCYAIEEDYLCIAVPKAFRRLFNRPENIAERTLLETISRGVLAFLQVRMGIEVGESAAQSIVSEIMPNPDMRIMHLFEARDPGTQLSGQGLIQEPTFIQPEDQALCRLGLASRIDPSIPKATLKGQPFCLKILNNGVSKLWEEIEIKLRSIDRLSVVTMALVNNEALLRDKSHWGDTARALSVIHSDSSNVRTVSHRREVDRIRASLASRILVEMAICVAPVAGGAPASKEAFDLLSAWIISLIELAYWSDAIKDNLALPEIHIHNNGAIEANHEFLTEVLEPYGRETFREQFRQSAESYHLKYEPKTSRASPLSNHHPGLAGAFSAEYGLQVDEYYDILAELWDCAIERSAAVVALSIRELRNRLRNNRNLSDETIDNFIKAFALHPRERWDQVPRGFKKNEFWPWRYQRRLSLSMRPLVIVHPSEPGLCIFGIQTIGQSLDYVLGRINEGWLSTETVSSAEMKVHIGRVAEEKGEEFEAHVAAHFCEPQWKARQRVQLTSLGAPPDLGDIDVLTWKCDGGRSIAIECKRLKPARTVGEVGEQLLKFKGEARDRLDRHLNRMAWLNSNSDVVRARLGIPRRELEFESLLVTNVIVPMQYIANLPLPPDRILPFSKLKEYVSQISASSRQQG